MFTGIIEATATVTKTKKGKLTLSRPRTFTDIKLGSSIAISGVCLSVTAFDRSSMQFDVIPTTLNKTTLGSLNIGDSVNLERAMPATGRFEGHIVLGHCEGVGTVHSILKKGKDWIITIRPPTTLKKYIVGHGSIAIDGVSLTVAKIDKGSFVVALIPHTLTSTTLGALRKGSFVNLETDILGKYAR